MNDNRATKGKTEINIGPDVEGQQIKEERLLKLKAS